MGGPKALLRDASGRPAVARGVDVLREGGCPEVTVVVGAAAEQVAALVPDDVEVVPADEWREGMGASLRAALSAPGPGTADAAVVMLADLPDVGPDVLRRLLAAAAPVADALARATYDGRPGHPVLIGRDHWAGVSASAAGDRGARDYLATHRPLLVECGDLASGRDTDTPADL